MATTTRKRAKSKVFPSKPKGIRKTSAAVKMLAKKADEKGRVALGGDFANRPVLIERISETEVRIKMAQIIPVSEAWLYANPDAFTSVRKGLAQAQAAGLGDGPDVTSDASLASELED